MVVQAVSTCTSTRTNNTKVVLNKCMCAKVVKKC